MTEAGIPHSAFNLPGWQNVAAPRESVEVRAIVIEPRRNESHVKNGGS